MRWVLMSDNPSKLLLGEQAVDGTIDFTKGGIRRETNANISITRDDIAVFKGERVQLHLFFVVGDSPFLQFKKDDVLVYMTTLGDKPPELLAGMVDCLTVEGKVTDADKQAFANGKAIFSKLWHDNHVQVRPCAAPHTRVRRVGLCVRAHAVVLVAQHIPVCRASRLWGL